MLGQDVGRADLLERYHAIVYAVGTDRDNRLGVPGEDRPSCHSATEFVAWYNGHPAHAHREFDLSATHAVVIGNGNVAVDVARMLVLDPGEIAVTDTADHAIAALSRARVQHVTVLGRRGPAQAAFTNPELRELGELTRADVVVDPADLELDEHSAHWLETAADATARQNVEILSDYAQRPVTGKSHRLELRFLRSPLEVIGDGDHGALTGLRVVRNAIDADLRAVPTGEEEILHCGLVLRAIGYRGRPLPGVPFDERRGLIPNAAGRLTSDDGEPLAGEYAVGWIKRGPTGVIGTNKKDSAETMAKMIEDRDAKRLNEPADPDPDRIAAWLGARVSDLVTWEGWRLIDEHELNLGQAQGRPRVKLVRVPEMLGVARR